MESFKCDDCGKCFTQKSSLNKHLNLKAQRKIMASFKCGVCGKCFTRKSSLNTHLKVQHKINMASFKCDVCGKCFTQKSSLNKHLKVQHKRNITHEYDAYSNKCLDCKISFTYIAELREHLQSRHNMQMEDEKLEFPNEEEFNRWIDSLPETLCCEFILAKVESRKEMRTNELIEYKSYKCSRSVATESKNKKSVVRKRRMKSQGSKKLQHTCTSQIVVNKTLNGKHSVTFYKTHYGHDLDIQHMRITKHKKRDIAAQLASGIPVERILEMKRESVDGETKSRVLRRKDVYNIKQGINRLRKKLKTELNAILDEALGITDRETLLEMLSYVKDVRNFVSCLKEDKLQRVCTQDNLIVIENEEKLMNVCTQDNLVFLKKEENCEDNLINACTQDNLLVIKKEVNCDK